MKNTVMGGLKFKLPESKYYRMLLIVVLVISIVLLVYLTDGIAKSYSHLIYIPIIMSAYFWGTKGGTSIAIISGILIGPFMPISVSEGIMQNTNNWMLRLIVLAIVGFITGYIFQKINKLNEKEKESYLISPLTGANNINRLINDMYEKINNEEKFAIVSIKLVNIEQMNMYIEHNISEVLSRKLVNELSNTYGKNAVYTMRYDEINLLFSLNYSYLEECKRIFKLYSTGFKVNQFTFRISMKIGIYEYHGTNESPIEIYHKARIASEQGELYENGIYLYDKKFDINRKEYIEILSSLYNSINNNELYLVYQPKINIADNRISGVEVLCRWDRNGRNPVGPDVFIKVAEEIGFINEISKFVLDNSFSQILDWNKKGIVLDFSINATAVIVK